MSEWAGYVSNILLFCLVFGMSSSTRFKTIKARVGDKTGILIGLGCQFFIMPLVGFLTVSFIKLDPLYAMMIIVVTSSPGGSYSNLMCSLTNGDLALSIAMTTASSCLAMIALPANLLFYSHLAFDNEEDKAAKIKWVEFCVSLGVVIGGILTGLYCSYKLEENIELDLEERRSSMRSSGGENRTRHSSVASSVASDDSELAVSFAKVIPVAENESVASSPNEEGKKYKNGTDFAERTSSMKKKRPKGTSLPWSLRSSEDASPNAYSEDNRMPGTIEEEGGTPISSMELSKRLRSMAAGFGNICGVALIVFSMFVGQANAPIWNREPEFFAGVFAACGSGLLLTFIVTLVFKVSDPQRVAITIEACYQNVGIATSMALGMYEGDDQIKAVGIPLLYGFAECVLLAIFGICAFYKNWTYADPKDVGFFEALLGVYQGKEAEEVDFEGIDVNDEDLAEQGASLTTVPNPTTQ